MIVERERWIDISLLGGGLTDIFFDTAILDGTMSTMYLNRNASMFYK